MQKAGFLMTRLILGLDTDSERHQYAIVSINIHNCKLDLEDILDLDTDSERHQYARVSINLQDCKLDLEDACI